MIGLLTVTCFGSGIRYSTQTKVIKYSRESITESSHSSSTRRANVKMRNIKSLNGAVITLLLVFQITLIIRHSGLVLPFPYWEEQTAMRRSENYVVPNIVHLIRFGNSNLTFIEAVCMLAALKNQKPDELLVHSDQREFDGGYYWGVVTNHSSAKGVVRVKYLPQPESIYGQPYSNPFGLYHKSDTERLRIVKKYGGIYIDNDVYIVQSLNKFRHYEMTLGWERGGNISDQVIIAAKNARFLNVWLESYKDYRPDLWFYNGGELPTRLLEERPYLIHRVEHRLAEWQGTPFIIYYVVTDLWKMHYAIHLLIRHQKAIISRNLSETATYPVVFNETNIMNYEANIKYMALDVYPFPELQLTGVRDD